MKHNGNMVLNEQGILVFKIGQTLDHDMHTWSDPAFCNCNLHTSGNILSFNKKVKINADNVESYDLYLEYPVTSEGKGGLDHLVWNLWKTAVFSCCSSESHFPFAIISRGITSCKPSAWLILSIDDHFVWHVGKQTARIV